MEILEDIEADDFTEILGYINEERQFEIYKLNFPNFTKKTFKTFEQWIGKGSNKKNEPKKIKISDEDKKNKEQLEILRNVRLILQSDMEKNGKKK